MGGWGTPDGAKTPAGGALGAARAEAGRGWKWVWHMEAWHRWEAWHSRKVWHRRLCIGAEGNSLYSD